MIVHKSKINTKQDVYGALILPLRQPKHYHQNRTPRYDSNRIIYHPPPHSEYFLQPDDLKRRKHLWRWHSMP